MKIKSCLEDAREDVLRALEFIKGVPISDQAYIARRTSELLNEVDHLLARLNKTETAGAP